ncbi:phospholipase A(1) LCAT3 [Olea europaea subsp. europaea]|uniref:Phospholipase A(1) LCAT3 n=1 Tax=Olea europaea subsp. europaea TaxID=158383 RepID=A0A8S0T8F9_OLEEU|nr:phospholipase A(1) LCAT3 [Olea europaea subsp. europaea]
MLRDFWCFHPGIWSSDSDDVADRDPVVLVSGIAGSILNSKNKKFGCQTRVWVRILLADLEFKRKLFSIYNPKTGYTEELDDSSEIVVPQDDYGLYAIDILDPSTLVKCTQLTDCYHFHNMIDMLVGCGYKKGTTLFGYGYDFRQSNRIGKAMNGLHEKLKAAYKASGGRKVNLISHSMGGLLILCFISHHSDVFSQYVNKWITIATPFQGAPGCINDTLLTGVQFVEGFKSFFFVSRWSMHQLVIFPVSRIGRALEIIFLDVWKIILPFILFFFAVFNLNPFYFILLFGIISMHTFIIVLHTMTQILSCSTKVKCVFRIWFVKYQMIKIFAVFGVDICMHCGLV